MSIEDTPKDGLPPRTDLLTALVTIVLGGAIATGSWTMDRLEHLHINKYEAPGLVPGLLGAAMLILGIMLALRSLRRAAREQMPAGTSETLPTRDMALLFGLTLFYALVLVGRGIPFWFGTLVFVSAFIYLFDGPRQAELGRSRARRLVLAAVYGLSASVIVTLVFQHIFYVRLP